MISVDVGHPLDNDWPWIIEHHVDTAWASLTTERQQAVSKQIVRDCILEQLDQIREKHGTTNQVFIARNENNNRIGFVWVDLARSGFTGVVQAYILSVYVEEAYRGQGVGSRLMSSAEDWARERNLTSVGLSVAAQNEVAIHMYARMGYEVETLRLSKKLERPTHGK